MSHWMTAAETERSVSIAGKATFTTDSSTYAMLEARIVATSTQSLALAAQSPATRTDWMVPSSHGLDLTLGTRDCSSRPNFGRTLTLSAFDRRSVVDVFQESCGWREKHIAGFGEAEIQQTIVV